MAIRKIRGKLVIDLRNPLDGKRLRITSPENSRRGAQAFELVLRQKLARGEPIKAPPCEEAKEGSTTFKEFAPHWLETYATPNNKPSEVTTKESTLRVHLIPWFGEMALDEIGSHEIEQYKAAKLKSGLSPKTINNHLAALSKCLNCAIEWGQLTVPPRIKKMRTVSQRLDFLSPAESGQLLQDQQEQMWNAMILTALRTGMRFGELLGLEWKDIDWGRKIITVRQSLVRGILGTPKNGKTRHIPMTDEVVSALEKMKRPRGHVFSLDEQTHRVALNAIHRICKRSGVRKVSWHILRHTFASQLVAEGIPLPAVKELLGHSSIVMTMKYSHLAPSALGDAVNVLQRAEAREMAKSGHYMGTASETTPKIEAATGHNGNNILAQPIQKHPR